MKKFLASLLVAVQIICLLPTATLVNATTADSLYLATNSVELYVQPDAEADGDGTQAQPFATLQEAADKIADILAEDPNTTINVNLMDGKHVLQETLTLGAAHSSSAKVTFRNASGATPIITSGQEIDGSGFMPVAGTGYYAYQFAEADKVNGAYPEFRELQINGKSAVMAKTKMYTFTADVGTDGAFTIPVEALAGITDDDLEGAELMMASEWQVYGLHFGSIEPDTDKYAKLYIEASDWNEYVTRVRTKRDFTGRTYFLQNHIAYLDEPGEFYYDQSTGTIYYYPYADENLAECTVEYAMLERLIYMKDAYNYVFDGLTFTGTSNTRFNHQAMLFGNGAYPTYYYDEGPEEIAGAICGTYTSDLTVKNCTFTELDTGGIMFEYGVKNFNIEGNTFRELGMHAIALGAKQLVWNSNDIPGGVENVLISNNYVDHIGLEVLCATGIRVAKAMNTKVLHNTVKNVPYSGIGMGMGFTLVQPNDNFINLYNVEIAYNHVENYMYNGNDGGAIYICGANATVDYKETDRVSIHDNYIKANGYDKTAVGIYHDGSASNVHTYNNVIVDVANSTHGVIFTQWHVQNQLAHNILIENNYTTIQGPTCGLGEEYKIVFKNNQVFADSSKLPAEALAIIQTAGVEDDYVTKPVYLEMSKLDNSVHYAINRYDANQVDISTVATFKLTNNDTAARKLSLVIEGLPEGVTYEVSGNGTLLQPGGSTTVTVTFTADPDTFAPSEVKAMLKLSVVEENGRAMNYPKAISLMLKQPGTKDDPFLIYDADDLKAISTKGLDKHYKLMADIDLSGISNWTPIAATGTRFTGSLDGNGYTISNMKVTSVNGQCLGGLFGWIEYPAVVKNLTLENASVSIDHNYQYTTFGGLVAAYNMGGTIDNCKVTGTLSVTNAQAKTVYLGGVVGISKTNGADKTATIVNCISGVDITLTCPAGAETYIGGIVAQASAADNVAYKAIVANCGYLGDITVNSALTSGTYVAGIVGWMESANNASATKSQLHNCYSTGSITGLTYKAYYVHTGAIYGRLRYTNVSNVYALSDVATAHPGQDLQNAASVTNKTDAEMKSASFAKTMTAGADALNSGVLNGSAVEAMDWVLSSDYPVLSEILDGTMHKPYLIYDADDLKAIKNGLDKHYKLMADIDLTSIAAWNDICIVGFTGTFDGNGHTIKLKCNGTTNRSLSVGRVAGLFGSATGATFRNVTIDADIVATHTVASAPVVGTLVAYAQDCTFENCTVNGSITLTGKTDCRDIYVGALVGLSSGNTVKNCVSNTSVTVTYEGTSTEQYTFVGGLLGKDMRSAISGSSVTGDVTVKGTATTTRKGMYVGGVVGHGTRTTIDYVVNSGDVQIEQSYNEFVCVGGIVGFLTSNDTGSAYLVDAINNGAINVKTNWESRTESNKIIRIGGVVGQISTGGQTVYLVNVANNGDITIDAKSGDFTPYGNVLYIYQAYVGGVLGAWETNTANLLEFHNAYNSGVITGISYRLVDDYLNILGAPITQYVAAIYGRNRAFTYSGLYALTGTADNISNAVEGGAIAGTFMSADEMKATSFALDLTGATETLNRGVLANSTVRAMSWMPTKDGYPVLTSNKVYGTSLNLGNNLALSFYYDGTPADGAYAVVTRTKADGTTETETLTNWTQNSQGIYRVTYTGIAAKEMGDTVMVVFYDKDGNAVCTPKSDSVAAYINRVMEDETNGSKLMEVCVDLLNYGAAAQVKFGYDTENLVNSGLTEAQKTLAIPTVTDSSVDCDATVGASLLLESDITMRLYFDATKVTSDMSAVVSYTNHYGKTKSYSVGGNDFVTTDNGIYIPVTGLVIADYDVLVTVQIKNSAGVEVHTVKDSMASYVARALEDGDDIFKAIMALGASADAYFDSL